MLYLQVVEQATQQVASPLWLTVSLSVFLFVTASARGIRSSEIALSTSLVLLAFLGPDQTGFRNLDDPSVTPLILAAIMQVWAGWKHRVSAKVFAGTLCCVVLTRSLIPIADPFLLDVSSWYFTLAAVLIVGLGMRDRFAHFLRHVAAWMLMASCLVAPFLPRLELPELGTLHLALHMIGASIVSLLLSWRTRQVQFHTAALINSSATTIGGGIRFVQFLLRLPGGKGILWAIGGLLWFGMAALISARKAGVSPLQKRLADAAPKQPSAND